jgi:hypothetical protein
VHCVAEPPTLYVPAMHSGHAGVFVPLPLITCPPFAVTVNVFAGHDDPLYRTVLELIVAQPSGFVLFDIVYSQVVAILYGKTLEYVPPFSETPSNEEQFLQDVASPVELYVPFGHGSHFAFFVPSFTM